MTQQEALDILQLGNNVFLTGAAGSGKTHLLNQYIAYLRDHGVNIAITASTGIAATHIGGQTIHSWSGIGINESLSDDDVDRISSTDRIKRNYKKTKVLIIDEISMLHARQLNMVDTLARAVLDETQPFGGLQVILCGDFFQLPPVTRSSYGVGGSDEYENKFAYECPAWEEGDFTVCYLHEQFRHTGAGDPLIQILSDIRTGTTGEHTKVPLRTRYKTPPETSTDITPTKLFSKNINVDAINQRELEANPNQLKTFTMETHGFKKLVDGLQRNCLAPEELHLKKGAEVMFVKNDPEGRYVNGTRGVIESFDSDSGNPVVHTGEGTRITAEPVEWRLEEDGSVRATIKQLPLRLAWAITIHKSQGMTLDAVELDLSDAFEPGMGYVALSRVRSLSGLTLLGLNDVALSVHPQILTHDAQFREWSDKAAEVICSFSTEEKTKKKDAVLTERFCGTRDKELVKKRKKHKACVKKTPSHVVTAELVTPEKMLEDVAEERGLALTTIVGHLEKVLGTNDMPDITHLKASIPDFDEIFAAFEDSEDGKLTPIFKHFKEKYSFETLRIVRLCVQAEQ